MLHLLNVLTILYIFNYTCFSDTVDPSVLEELKKEEINKEKLTSTVTNIITYSIYIFLLIALATTMNGQKTYYQKEHVERLTKVNATLHQIYLILYLVFCLMEHLSHNTQSWQFWYYCSN